MSRASQGNSLVAQLWGSYYQEGKICDFCAAHKPTQRGEQLVMTPLPSGHWQRIADDLCELEGKSFLIVVDYFSRDNEIAPRATTTSRQVIDKLKHIFVRWEILLELVSDNATQFTSAEFQDFKQRYGFTQITSSPYYPMAPLREPSKKPNTSSTA